MCNFVIGQFTHRFVTQVLYQILDSFDFDSKRRRRRRLSGQVVTIHSLFGQVPIPLSSNFFFFSVWLLRKFSKYFPFRFSPLSGIAKNDANSCVAAFRIAISFNFFFPPMYKLSEFNLRKHFSISCGFAVIVCL